MRQIEIYGDLNQTKQLANTLLEHCLKKIITDVDEKILFIGSRKTTTQALHSLATQVIPHKIGCSFEFNDLGILHDESGKRTQVIILKIPQGDAAYDATKIFIAHGVNKIIMTATGDALNAQVNIGDYVFIDRAEYQGESIILAPEQLVSMESNSYLQSAPTNNVTVNSPLDETDSWYEQYKDYGCVDVETFHIFKATNESKQVRIILGMFISDIVNKTPLIDLLSGSITSKNIADFSLKALNVMRSIPIAAPVIKTSPLLMESKAQGSLPQKAFSRSKCVHFSTPANVDKTLMTLEIKDRNKAYSC